MFFIAFLKIVVFDMIWQLKGCPLNATATLSLNEFLGHQ